MGFRQRPPMSRKAMKCNGFLAFPNHRWPQSIQMVRKPYVFKAFPACGRTLQNTMNYNGFRMLFAGNASKPYKNLALYKGFRQRPPRYGKPMKCNCFWPSRTQLGPSPWTEIPGPAREDFEFVLIP